MSEEKTLEILTDFFNAVEAACVNCKRQIAEIVGITEKKQAAVLEEIFNALKFEAQTGEKLGDFETADKSINKVREWTTAFGILTQNKATIENRFHGPGYAFSYWLYKDRIFRKKLNPKLA